MGGRFLLSILLTLNPAFALCENVVVHRVWGFSTEKAPTSLNRPSQTVWVDGRPEPPIVAHMVTSLRDVSWYRGGRTVHNPPFTFAIYDDGTVLFSQDTLLGGPPYYERTLSSQEMDTVYGVVETVRETPNVNELYMHGSKNIRQLHHKITVAHDGDLFGLYSDHLYQEALGELLATYEGYIEADGRCFAEIAHAQPLHYVEYRQTWQDVLELRSIFDDAAAAPIGELETEHVFAHRNGQYAFPDNFEDRRISRLLLEAYGSTIKIDEFRELYQHLPPLNPAGSCD